LWLSEDSPIRNYPEFRAIEDSAKKIVRGKKVVSFT